MSFFSNATKGFIQLVFIAGFVVFSFSVSAMLQSRKPVTESDGNQNRPVFVETQNVSPATHRISFETTGVIEARTNIDVVSQVSGQVIRVNENFFEGGEFKKDEILFEIDPRDFELAVERLQAEVARARTTFTLEQAESKAALAEWKLINGDRPAPQLVARKPQVDEAWANLKAAKASLKDAELDLERTKIKLPFDGRVLSSTVSTGLYVTAGQGFAQVFDKESLEVRASLESDELKWLLNTDEVEIHIAATYLGETKSYTGFLKRGIASLDQATRFATVSFGIENPENLLPGIFTDIKVLGPVLDNVTQLPVSSLQKGGLIWAVDNEDRLKAFEGEVIYSSDDYIATKGVDADITVVTSRLDGGSEGMQVTISEAEE